RGAEALAGGGVVVLHVDDDEREALAAQRNRLDEREAVVEEGSLRHLALLSSRSVPTVGRLSGAVNPPTGGPAHAPGRRAMPPPETAPECRPPPRGGP